MPQKQPARRPDFDEVTIIVPGLIQPWKRVRQNRKTGTWYTDPKVETYQSSVRHEAMLVMAGDPPIPREFALELSFLAVWPIPTGWSKKLQAECRQRGGSLKRTAPDSDNTVKGIMDALQHIVYVNDSQIAVQGRCAKIYGDRPRLEIRFTILDEDTVPLSLPKEAVYQGRLPLF